VGRRLFLGSAAVVGVVLTVTLAASATSQATSMQVATVMNATQEVPAPTGNVSGAQGTFKATVTKSDTGASVAWDLTFSGLTGNAVAAHIHQGAPGAPGAVVLALCGPCQSPMSGTGNLSQAALDALQAGDAYVNVHTPTNGAGEIRGQLGSTASIATSLNARQERPKPKGNVGRATGTFTATVAKLGAKAQIAWRLKFSRLTGRALAAHIHIGQRGKAGPVVVPLCGPCRSGAKGTASLTTATVRALENGRAYVNIHTKKNPAGEIRGQIRAIALNIS